MGGDRIYAFADTLWRKRAVRRAAFWAGLIVQLAMIGAALGLTLTPSGDRATHRHASAAIRAVPPVADRDGG